MKKNNETHSSKEATPTKLFPFILLIFSSYLNLNPFPHETKILNVVKEGSGLTN